MKGEWEVTDPGLARELARLILRPVNTKECPLCGHRNHVNDEECGNCHGVVL